MMKKSLLIHLLEKERLSLDYIQNYSSTCSKSIADIKNLVSSSEDITDKECQVILDHFDLYKNSTADFKNFFKLYDSALTATINHLRPPRVKWVPEDTSNLKMRCIKGKSPWLIYLTYVDSVELSPYLESCHNDGTLQAVSQVKQYDFVCCKENDEFHRAVVLNIARDASMTTLYLIDSGATVTSDHTNLFELPNALVDLPAQCMQCIFNNSLSAEDKNLWPKEMGAIFENLLLSFDLYVSIVAEKDSFPPVFLIDIATCHNQPKSLNDWMSKSLFPELESLEEGLDFEELLFRLQRDGMFDLFFSEPESSPSESFIQRLGNALYNFFYKIFFPIQPLPVDPSTNLFGSLKKLNLISVHQKEEAPEVGDQPLPRAAVSGAIGQILEYTPVMRNELQNFSIELEIGSVLVIRILKCITLTSAYILMPIKFSMFDGDKRAWSQLNENLNEVSTIDSYEDYVGTPVENEVVIVKSSSGLFRRAKVVQISSPTQIKVFFIDHGYFESVKLSCVKNMLKRLTKIPAQAVKADFKFSSVAKPICETSVVLVKVLKVDKVDDEMELTFYVGV